YGLPRLLPAGPPGGAARLPRPLRCWALGSSPWAYTPVRAVCKSCRTFSGASTPTSFLTPSSRSPGGRARRWPPWRSRSHSWPPPGPPPVPLWRAGRRGSPALRWRGPPPPGLVRGWRGAPPPLACVLALTYGGLLLATARQEAVVQNELSRTLQHQGRALAED